jgi:hypothetical protein
MTSKGGGLTGNTFHHASIAQKDICVVVDQVKTRLVKLGRRVVLGNGKTNGVGETLAQRTSSDLNAISIMRFGMTRCDAIYRLRGIYQLLSIFKRRSIGL